MSADDGRNCDPNGRTRAGCLDSKETHITLAIRPNSDRKTGGAASPQSSEIETKRWTGFDSRLSVLSPTSKAPGGDDGSRDSMNNGCLLSLEQGNSTSYPGNSIPRSLSQYSQDETDKRSHNHLDCNDPGKLACDPILEVRVRIRMKKTRKKRRRKIGIIKMMARIPQNDGSCLQLYAMIQSESVSSKGPASGLGVDISAESSLFRRDIYLN